ncbi:hypothetical protein DPEC_G00186090 [Dallia pectoralis]|uniref:Uncharacterized protein n=1 Tax=Dallia pectoralis TaxID=75939 RepID=A0ACC2GBN5_DALPE|nr:hypothetical protein DPEC_G00186090 [Dallia pectoralis]
MSVDERKPCLFGKFSSSLSARDKDYSWQEVADAVTAVCGVVRTVDAVKKVDIHRKRGKEEGALFQKEKGKTGGGQLQIKPLTVHEEKILGVMGKVYTEGLPSGSEVGLPETPLLASSDPDIILTLVESKKKRTTDEPHLHYKNAQEELLHSEREKVKIMKEQLEVNKERLKLDMAKFELFKDYCKKQEANGFNNAKRPRSRTPLQCRFRSPAPGPQGVIKPVIQGDRRKLRCLSRGVSGWASSSRSP